MRDSTSAWSRVRIADVPLRAAGSRYASGRAQYARGEPVGAVVGHGHDVDVGVEPVRAPR